jgi:hypothetical protein
MLFFVYSIWRRLKYESDLFRSLLFLNTDKLFWPTASFGIGATLFIAEQAGAFFLTHPENGTIHGIVESLYITFTLLGLVLLTQEVLKVKNNHEI